MTKIATLCFAGHLLLSSLFLICGGYEAWAKLLRIKHISRYLLHPASLGDRSYYCLLLFNMVVVPIIFFWYHFSSLKSPPPLFSNTLCFKAQTSPSSSCRLPRWFQQPEPYWALCIIISITKLKFGYEQAIFCCTKLAIYYIQSCSQPSFHVFNMCLLITRLHHVTFDLYKTVCVSCTIIS